MEAAKDDMGESRLDIIDSEVNRKSMNASKCVCFVCFIQDSGLID